MQSRCSPGEAWADLYAGAKQVRPFRIEVGEPRPFRVSLTPPPSALKVGQSRVFTLNSLLPNPPGVRVIVNHAPWLSDAGNIAFDRCPGGDEEGRLLGPGDTVTIVGCAPGAVSLGLAYPRGKDGEYISQDHSMSVWGK